MSNPLVGSTVLVRLTVTDPTTGEPADATVDLEVVAPDGTQTSESPDHPSTGVYTFPLPLDQAGWWTTIWTATSGDLVTVIECKVCAADSILSEVSA
jgi:hypothetical protein